MAPLLYNLNESPPTCAVRMLADIIGLELDLKDVDFDNMEHKSPDYVKLNPVGVVPTLVDDGFALGDSHAIMIYLVSKYGGDKSESLYPSNLRTRATINQVMFFDASIFFIRINDIALPAIVDGLKAPSERQLSALDEAYGMLEAFLSRHKYVAADHLTIADLSVATTLFSAVAVKELDTKKFPLCASWFKKIQEESSYKKIAVPGAEGFSRMMEFCWQKNNQ